MYDLTDKVERYLTPELPRLISFPRCGSHWVRMVLELYLERPCLTRAFYYPEAEPWGIHTHDRCSDQDEVAKGAKYVVYLRRRVVDVVFSESYYRGITEPRGWLGVWKEYSRHLMYWGVEASCAPDRVVLDVSYEDLRGPSHDPWVSMLKFLGCPYVDFERLDQSLSAVTKKEVRERSQYEPRAMPVDPDYNKKRQEFKRRFHEEVYRQRSLSRA